MIIYSLFCWCTVVFLRLLDCVHCIVLYIYFMLPFGVINREWWWKMVSVTVMWCVGIPDDRDGLFDTILLSKNQYQKRAYQCIKMMVSLFTLYACCFSAILLAEYLLFNLHSFTAVFLHCWLYVASIMASQIPNQPELGHLSIQPSVQCHELSSSVRNLLHLNELMLTLKE